MTTTTTHPTLTTIPLSALTLSKHNVRRSGAKDGIETLAASIAAHGLRQNLNVRPEGERFEVVAGGRRLRALRLLAKRKSLPKNAPIPCLVLTGAEQPSEVSLAENVQRLAMHPLDEFEAFDQLVREQQMPVEDIAARFGVTPLAVQRRLKLANVSPALRKFYRSGDMTLEQLMAFTVSDDHAAQAKVWSELPEWRRQPEQIKAMLTGEAVSATDRLSRFVGLDTYSAAGGAIMRDLFDEDSAGFLTDRALLLRLASDKLEGITAEVQAEGWKWVKAELERDYSPSYRRIWPTEQDEDAEDTSETFDAAEMSRAGAIVRIDRNGEVEIDRGLVLPEDSEPATGGNGASPAKRKPVLGELPAVLVQDLTAHRTAALRMDLARNPDLALAATVHALALPLLYGERMASRSCLELSAKSEPLERHVAVAEDCIAHAALAEDAAGWDERLPESPDTLLDWCLSAGRDTLLSLLAYLAALSLNAVQMKQAPERGDRLAHADALAEALALDMPGYWKPSVEGFYGRVSKATLRHIVTEAQAPMTVQIDGLKKQEAARYVTKAMAECRWLPLPLRAAQPDTAVA